MYEIILNQPIFREPGTSSIDTVNSGLRNRPTSKCDHAHHKQNDSDDCADQTTVPVAMNVIFSLPSENDDYSGFLQENAGNEIVLEKSFSRCRRSASVDAQDLQAASEKPETNYEWVSMRENVSSTEALAGSKQRTRHNLTDDSRYYSRRQSSVKRNSGPSQGRAVRKSHPVPVLFKSNSITPNRRFSLAEVLLRNQEIQQQSRMRSRRTSRLIKSRQQSRKRTDVSKYVSTPHTNQEYSILRDRTDRNAHRWSNLSATPSPERSKNTSSTAKQLTLSGSNRTDQNQETPDKRSSPVDTAKIMSISELQIEPNSILLNTTGTYERQSNERRIPGSGLQTNTSEALDKFPLKLAPDIDNEMHRNSGRDSCEASMPDDTSVIFSVLEVPHLTPSPKSSDTPLTTAKLPGPAILNRFEETVQSELLVHYFFSACIFYMERKFSQCLVSFFFFLFFQTCFPN